MSYCYGLSVIHSHLLRGAGLILTDRSVVDDEFWALFRRHRGTSFAGVPYTFEMLERIGFDGIDLPDLRYVTQAGGRLSPERVRSFAELGARKGWQLFVMYGATEATARMAYLPPELAQTHPGSIGRPIPGGSFSLEPLEGWSDPDVGELVYHGPNVMMGYAHGPADLALGKTVDTLHTGDVARRDPDGLYEVIGRSSRFVKLYGLRIDLQRVEAALSAQGVTAFCIDDDDRLVVDAEGRHTLGAQRGLDSMQIDAKAIKLDEAAAAADHLVQPVGVSARDVSGMQCVDGLAERQVRRTVRVAHHHVRPVEDQLTDVGIGPSLQRLEGEGAAGDRPADRAGVRLRELWWQV